MALRVLLADESLNIKKNLQMALQDFGVEVKVVLNGDEVLSVSKTFKPDIYFLDILLPKINGYDACAQIKNHPDFRHRPVVLLWSSFMDIDENKFRHSKADGRLEKPFDKDTLRKLIQHLVPKTRSQRLSEFLTFPHLQMEEDESHQPEGQTSQTSSHSGLRHFEPKELPESQGAFARENFDNSAFPEGFSPFQSMVPEISPLTSQNDEFEEWIPRPITRSGGPLEEKYEVEIANVQIPPDEPLSATPELDTLPVMGRPRKNINPPTQYAGPPPQIQLDQKQLDDLIRKELKGLIEQAIAKTLPEIAERIIRDEISRLMNEAEDEI